MSNTGRTFAETRHMLNFYHIIHWYVLYERSNFPVIFEVILLVFYLMILRAFFQVSCTWRLDGRPVRSRSSTAVSQHLNTEANSKVCVLPWNCHWKLFVFLLTLAIFPILKRTFTQKFFSLAESRRLHIIRTTINTHRVEEHCSWLLRPTRPT